MVQGQPNCSVKRPFNVQEDRMLINFVQTHGAKNWNTIASQLQFRTAKQCRERWHNHLDPTINKGPWTAIEDKILAIKHQELGNRWADIARFLPGRTDTLVKNRWNTSVKDRVHELWNQPPNASYGKNSQSMTFHNVMPQQLNVPRFEMPPLRFPSVEPKVLLCSESIIRNFNDIRPLLLRK